MQLNLTPWFPQCQTSAFHLWKEIVRTREILKCRENCKNSLRSFFYNKLNLEHLSNHTQSYNEKIKGMNVSNSMIFRLWGRISRDWNVLIRVPNVGSLLFYHKLKLENYFLKDLMIFPPRPICSERSRNLWYSWTNFFLIVRLSVIWQMFQHNLW